jgi:hypothetical protein
MNRTCLVVHQQNPVGADVHSQIVARVRELLPVTDELPGTAEQISAFDRRETGVIVAPPGQISIGSQGLAARFPLQPILGEFTRENRAQIRHAAALGPRDRSSPRFETQNPARGSPAPR